MLKIRNIIKVLGSDPAQAKQAFYLMGSLAITGRIKSFTQFRMNVKQSASYELIRHIHINYCNLYWTGYKLTSAKLTFRQVFGTISCSKAI